LLRLIWNIPAGRLHRAAALRVPATPPWNPATAITRQGERAVERDRLAPLPRASLGLPAPAEIRAGEIARGDRGDRRSGSASCCGRSRAPIRATTDV
jgi:hypothetical protein